MDSGNSGSMQSSSGGEEEYDSRPESIPSFLNPSSGHFGPLSNPHPSFLSHHQDHQPAFFDPASSNYLHVFSHQSQQNPSNPNSLLNLDAVRQRNLRSEPNCTDLGNLPGSQGLNQGPFSNPSSMQPRSIHDNGVRSLAPSDQTTNAVKNPKKRTRASRRAPTTVLTTDTSNFRAMVQEFTGIPAPPFSGTSYSRRLDLFGSSSAIRSGHHLEAMGPLYPLRPSPKKVHQQSPFVSSSSNSSSSSLMLNNIGSSTTSNDNTFNSSSSNYQLHSGLGLNMQNNQNPILPFQSLLQPSTLHGLHPSLNVSGFGAKSQGSNINLGMTSLEELGMGHGHINANNLGGLTAAHVAASDQDQLRPFDPNYGNSQRVNNGCKLNYSASSSSDQFHHEKGLENHVSSRGEGTVDSWICPSD